MWIVAYVLLHLVVYTVFRLQFLAWNWSSLSFDGEAGLIDVFWHGLRFDLSSIAATSVFFLIGLYWVARFRVARMILFSVFWLLNVSLLAINWADAELVNFTARRFTKGSLFLLSEGQNLNVIAAYWGLALSGIAVLGLYSYATLVLYRKIDVPRPFFLKFGLSFLTLLAAVVLFRGGFQSKPIMPVDGRLFDDPMVNHMVLNSTFTLMKSLNKPTVERLHYFDTGKMLGYLNKPSAATVLPALPRANVVIVVLESFSKEYTALRDPEFTPFLNRLAKEGAWFPYFYANSKSSIAGIPAILSGIPALMDDPFIDSEFSLNSYTGIASILGKQGYHTSFFHGANRNSMHFDAYAQGAGFQHHYARDNFPDRNGDDGKWGIYDGPFLQWICGKYSTFPEPFMSAVFTLSSHQPYSVPPAELDRHPDGSHPILKSIHYTDASLEQFMSCASKQKWFRNTIFVFTADHAGPALQSGSPFSAMFEIPLVLYAAEPKVFGNIDTSQLAQQIDLIPTVLDTVGIRQEKVNHLARSLWQPGQKIVPLYLDGTLQIIGLPDEAGTQLKNETRKAVMQYFVEGMLDDRLYYPASHDHK